MYVPQLSSPFVCQWTPRLLPRPGYCNMFHFLRNQQIVFLSDCTFLSTSSIQGFPNLHILTNMCYFLLLKKVAAAAAAKSLQTVRPHRRQPTRLPHPWDSPGKNTGVGCHFLLQCMKVKVKLLSRVRLLAAPWTAAYQAPPSMGFSRQEYWSGVPLPI